jgi:hypothetical protein
MNRSLEPFAPGDRVIWKWRAHWAEGTVRETFTPRVVRVIKGARIVRKGKADAPAYLIVQDSDAEVVKKQNELFRA